jgi:hypothetical protein
MPEDTREPYKKKRSTPRPMSGIIFRNQDKNRPGANPKWPDMKGDAVISGREYWLSGWVHDGKNGKFISIGFKEKVSSTYQTAATRERKRQLGQANELNPGQPVTPDTYVEPTPPTDQPAF